jgi:hypothetical protein
MLWGCAEAMIALFSMPLVRHYCIVDYLNSVACILVLPEDKKCWWFFLQLHRKYNKILCA